MPPIDAWLISRHRHALSSLTIGAGPGSFLFPPLCAETCYAIMCVSCCFHRFVASRHPASPNIGVAHAAISYQSRAMPLRPRDGADEGSSPSFGNTNMQVPSELKPAAWGAVAGAIALAVIGFNWGGWVTGATANKNAKEAADSAIVRGARANLRRKVSAAGRCRFENRRAEKGQRLGERHVCREGWLGDHARKHCAEHGRGARLC